MSLRIFVRCRSNQVPGENDYKANIVANFACQKTLDRPFSWVKDFRRCEGSFYGLAEVCHMVIDCNVDEADEGTEGIPLYYFKATGEGDDLSVFCTFYVGTSLMCNDSGLVAIDLKLRSRLDLMPWGDPEKAKAEEPIHPRSIHTYSPKPTRHPPLHTTGLTPSTQPHLLNTTFSAITNS